MDEQLYDQFAEVADSHWWFEGRRRVVEAVLQEALGPKPCGGAPPRTILDVGCGTGSMLEMLGRFGSVSGLEMSPIAAEVCRSQHGDAVDVQVGRIPEDLPPDGRFDVVCAFDVIEHIEDDLDAIGRIHDAVRAGGLFVSTVPAFPSLWGRQDVLSHHFRRYRRKPYRALLAAGGFEVERTTHFNTWLFPGIAAMRIGRRLLPHTGREPGSDLDVSSPGLDRVLTRVFASERHLVRRHPLPFGVSLLALARRPC